MLSYDTLCLEVTYTFCPRSHVLVVGGGDGNYEVFFVLEAVSWIGRERVTNTVVHEAMLGWEGEGSFYF